MQHLRRGREQSGGEDGEVFSHRDVFRQEPSAEYIELLTVCRFGAGVEEVFFVFGKLPEGFGFADPASTVENEELTFRSVVSLLQPCKFFFPAKEQVAHIIVIIIIMIIYCLRRRRVGDEVEDLSGANRKICERAAPKGRP